MICQFKVFIAFQGVSSGTAAQIQSINLADNVNRRRTGIKQASKLLGRALRINQKRIPFRSVRRFLMHS